MIYQLPNGRCVEISIEQYLDMTDEELQEFNCLGDNFTKELNNPFYRPYSKGRAPRKDQPTDQKYGVDNASNDEKLDKEFFNDDDQ